MLRTLGIETSCDESAAAVVDGAGRVEVSLLSSQIAAHAPYGGVVPELASREHLKALPYLVDQALEAACGPVEMVAVTAGPGLIGALLVGVRFAAAFAWGRNLPLVAVDHLEGHLVSSLLSPDGGAARAEPDRVLALVASGGHSSWYLMDHGCRVRLGRTRDDAAGESFDKVAQVLGLGYPGGPAIDWIREQGLVDVGAGDGETAVPVCDLAASFEAAVVEQLLSPLPELAAIHRPHLVTASGGVAANSLLRRALSEWGDEHGVETLLPASSLTTDNAVMIAHAGQIAHSGGRSDDPRRLDARAREVWQPPGMRRETSGAGV